MTRRHEEPIPRTNPSGSKAWVARATDRNGKRHYLGTRKLKREAQALIDEFYERQHAPQGAETVGHYFNGWLKRHPRSERTNVNYTGRINAVLDVDLEDRPLRDWPTADLHRGHAVDLLDHMLREQGRAARGAQGILRVLSAMWQDAIDDRAATDNPFMGVKLRANDPRVQKDPKTPRVWTWEQMHMFAADAGQWEPMIRVLSDCGLRIGELFPLERGDFHGEWLEIRRTSWRGRIEAGTKEDRLRNRPQGEGRTCPVPPELQALIEAMPKRIDTRLLFPSLRGDLWGDRRWYDEVWYPAQKASGMDIRPHEMRHSYVSLQRAAGVDPADLALACGHTVLTATSRYTHATGTSWDAMRGAVG